MTDKKQNTYQVIDPLKHNGEHYAPGESVEMTAAQAKQCPAVGHMVQSDPETDRLSRIVEAIRNLDVENETHWTKNGIPEVKALSAMLGRVVTATDRDLAWQQVQDESDA